MGGIPGAGQDVSVEVGLETATNDLDVSDTPINNVTDAELSDAIQNTDVADTDAEGLFDISLLEPSGTVEPIAVVPKEPVITITPDTQELSTTPPAEASKEDPALDDTSALRAQLVEAMGTINALQSQIQAPQDAKQQPTLAIPKDPRQVSSVDFLDGVDPVEFIEDGAKFNALLNKIATVAANAGKQAGYEMALASIPEIVQKTSEQNYNIRQSVDDFYTKNSDLVPFKQAVSAAAIQIYGKEPNLGTSEILEKAAVATRQILRLRGTQAVRKPAQPATATGHVDRNVAAASKTNTTEDQIRDLLSGL